MATPETEVLTENEQLARINADYNERFGFHDAENYLYKAPKGLNREIVEKISEFKSEPQWMRDFRLKALDHFLARPMPTWGSPALAQVDFDNIHYFVRASERAERSWDEVPEDVKRTFDRLGIPEAERKFLSGVGAQYESEVVYHQVREDLEKQGVIFKDMDSGLREHEDLVREYFATIIPANDNKLAALNSAVWSGGSFVYVPPGVHVEMPLQAYFRINTESMGQFERTLIIADEGSYVHYVEGCTAPTYSSSSLHSAVVELIAKPGARIRYTTVQNWSTNVFNLVTKRAVAHEDATVEWVDCNLGSRLTMKYPSVYLLGERAHGEILSIAFAGKGQHQDAGGKIIHAAPNTTSNIFAKSISKDGGRGSYRGLLEIAKGAHGARSKVVCDALLLDEESRSDTYPTIRISEDDVNVGHEATVSKVGDDQLFYLMSHGIPEDEASKLIVNGFIEPITKELPMEYAVEMNRLIELYLGSVVTDRDIFTARNEAGFQGGAFVYVPRGVALEQPIPLTGVQAATGTELDRRTLIVLEEGAQAEVWEQYVSGADDLDGLFNVVTELVVGDGARLRYVCGQALSEKSWIFGAQRAEVGRDGSLDWVALGFGSARGRVRMETKLAGEGAEARVTGAYASHGRQHIDFDTTQEHAAPNTSSDLAFRGVLQGRSTAVWKGNIIVDPGAQKTDAFQESRNLLISKRAHADAIPGLEIQANDVRCTHAAAVAQVDPEQLFYLRAHGLPEPVAKRLVIEGFLAALVERFEQGPVRELLADALERRLNAVLDG